MRIHGRSPVVSLLAALALAASGGCGTAPSPVGAGEEPPGEGLITIRIVGKVSDSLLSQPVGPVALVVGPHALTTDSAGAFQADVPQGALVISADVDGYLPHTVRSTVFVTTYIPVRLRRLAPAVTACYIDRDTVRATVIDLDGRKTIDRRERSRLRLLAPTPIDSMTAYELYWNPVDILTWHVLAPLGRFDVTDTEWLLEDETGRTTVQRCRAVWRPPLDTAGFD